MLAESADRAFSRAGWLFEPKLDGYRVLAARQGGDARLLTRNANDYTEAFPEITRAVAALPFDRVLLDGEVVALDEQGLPSFQRLQSRARLRRPIDIRHAAVEVPVTYYAFDLLGFEDFDLRPLPLTARKSVLQRVLPPLGALRYLEHVEEDGEALYHEAERLGLEGVVAQEGRRAVQGRALGRLAQGAVAEDRGLRGGGIHVAQGIARRVRSAASRRVRGRGADLHGAGWERVQREAARRGEPDARRRSGVRIRHAWGRCRRRRGRRGSSR